MEYLFGAIGALIFVLAIAWIFGESRDDLAYREIRECDDLEDLYYAIWNGHLNDRVAAWYRVIGHIETTDKWHLMPEAKQRLKKEEERDLSDSFVDVNYQLKLDGESV